MSTRARSREFGEFVVIGYAAEVDCRRMEKERREVKAEKGRRDVEYDGRGPEIECREVVEGRTALMSCEVDGLDVAMEGVVLEVCKEFLYAALDFRIGFSGTTELQLCR